VKPLSIRPNILSSLTGGYGRKGESMPLMIGRAIGYMISILIFMLIFSPNLSATQMKPVKKPAAANKYYQYVMMPWDVQRAIKQKKPIILVDVRDSGSFQKAYIPGSINIPLHAIKTKAYLKKDQIVLVNEGYRFTEESLACSQLRKAGFNAWIMNGGLSAWKRSGYEVIGDPFVIDDFNMVPPQAFYQEKRNGNWIVFDITKSGVGFKDFPKTVHVPVVDIKKHTPSLVSAIRKNAYKPYQFILIAGEDGSNYDAIEKSLKLPPGKNIFFLKGGAKDYAAFVRGQASADKPVEQRKVVSQGCPTCPKPNVQNDSRGLK
jgi:rhodanese-related sulfurtransferase